jgi:hypothetical protein
MGRSIDMDTPVSGLISIEYEAAEEYDADKDKASESDRDSKDTNEDGRPAKKRKRYTIIPR